jgi:hypothetical protein
MPRQSLRHWQGLIYGHASTLGSEPWRQALVGAERRVRLGRERKRQDEREASQSGPHAGSPSQRRTTAQYWV